MRLDKWLYYSRLFKTRSDSQKACFNGDVLVNKIKKINYDYKISKKDIITLIKKNKIYIVEVVLLPVKRISSKEIGKIYKLI